MYVHVSFDLVEQFIPRVPKSAIIGKINEDCNIKRICVSTSVQNALRGVPGSGYILKTMMNLGLPLLVHAYYLKSNNVIKPTMEQVPDVEATNEFWMLETPKSVTRVDYLLEDVWLKEMTDLNGITFDVLVNCNIKRVRYQNNVENLCNYFHVSYPNKVFENVTFRQFIYQCGEELSQLESASNI